MKLRLPLLALLILAGVGGLVYFFLPKPSEHPPAAAPQPPLPDPEPPPVPTPETAAQQAERLKDLDPPLREAVIHLENAVRRWEEQNPDADSTEWSGFVLGELDKWEPALFRSLVDAVITSKARLVMKYHSWIYTAWGYREPAAARDCMIKTAEMNGFLSDPGSFGDRHFRDWILANFEAVQVGHAHRDPVAAWQQTAEDLANPQMKYVSGELFAAYMMEFYAKQRPAEAWRAAIAPPADRAFFSVAGFGLGAPPGQDWPALLAEYGALTRSEKNREPGADRAVTSLLARWLGEDPDATLAWVSSHLTLQNFERSMAPKLDLPPELPGREPPPKELLLEMAMVRSVYRMFHEHTRLQNQIITRLISTGRHHLAALAIAEQLRGMKSDRRLHPLILNFPDAALRESLLLAASRKLPGPKHDTFGTDAEERHEAIYILWTLIDTIEVPQEAKDRARNRVREAYAAEQRAATERKLQGDSPRPPRHRRGGQ